MSDHTIDEKESLYRTVKVLIGCIAQVKEEQLYRAYKEVNEDLEELSVCTKCGFSAKHEEFSCPTGGDDFYVHCPECFADEELIFNVTELRIKHLPKLQSKTG